MKERIDSFRGEYGFLSNMYAAEFTWDGRTYRNSEAAFQSAKSLDPAERDEFSAMSGVIAKRAGRRVKLRPDWEQVKESVMEEILRAKFTQNPELMEKLLATGDAELVEGNRWHDRYWGVDAATGVGENRLGVILMKLRAELGDAEYHDRMAQQRAEREAARAQEQLAREAEIARVRAELAALPEYDFTGMEVDTKAFGRVTIKRQERRYIFFDALGKERKFAVPECVLQGFVTPEANIADAVRRRAELETRLDELEEGGVPG